MTWRVKIAKAEGGFISDSLNTFLTISCIFALVTISVGLLKPPALDLVVVPPTSDGQTLASHTSSPKPAKKKTIKKSTNLSSNNIENLSCMIDGPANPKLASSEVSQLRKLYDYQKVCGGSFTNRLMLFEATPASPSEAKALAQDVAFQLKEFNRFGISPVVILEPVTSKGQVNFKAYANGDYNNALDVYFGTLVSQGISSSMMGLWVSFPEANIPTWQTTDPTLFAACVSQTAKLQKKHFPDSQASILLQSMSYPNGWGSGAYVSLSPYIKNIPKGLIDSFGYQGFAWPDPQPDYNAADFLNPTIATAAAKQLGVKQVWFNTGTFNKGKAYNGKIINLSPNQRQNILDDILQQALIVKNSGFNTSVHLFSEDKSATAEGIDWSYLKSGPSVFTNFEHKVKARGMQFWLFDADD